MEIPWDLPNPVCSQHPPTPIPCDNLAALMLLDFLLFFCAVTVQMENRVGGKKKEKQKGFKLKMAVLWARWLLPAKKLFLKSDTATQD